MDVRSRIVGHGDEAPDQLLANPLNFRRHPGHQLAALRGSMKELGWVKTVLVNKRTGYVLDGHARVEEAMRQHLKSVPVTYVDLSPEEERLALAVLDPITEIAVRDQDALSALLADVTTGDADLQAFLAALGQEPEATILPGADLDEIPDPPADPVTKPGDLIILGRHRLLCGDSTNPQHAETLLAGAKAEVLFTDPPYGIAYKRMSGDHRDIANDGNEDEALRVTRDAIVLHPGLSAAFVCCDWRSMSTIVQAMEDAGLPTKACIVWDKERGVQNLDRFYKRHEFIVYSGPYGGQKTVDGDVWSCPRDFKPDHPTPKPVALIERALKAVDDGLVLDMFGGSGSTLIACESLGRSARLMELDPRYCDVIVARWENATGQKAQRPETHKESE